MGSTSVESTFILKSAMRPFVKLFWTLVYLQCCFSRTLRIDRGVVNVRTVFRHNWRSFSGIIVVSRTYARHSVSYRSVDSGCEICVAASANVWSGTLKTQDRKLTDGRRRLLKTSDEQTVRCKITRVPSLPPSRVRLRH